MNRDRAVAELALTSCTMYRPKVTPAQAEKGRRWLLDGSLTKAGALRKTPLVNSLRALSVIRDATTARLIGFENVATFDALLLGFSYYLPIYEYATRDGRTFTYCPRPGGIVTNY